MLGRLVAMAALALAQPESAGAQAQSRTARAPLAADETALQVFAKGSSTLPADTAAMHLNLRRTGQTEQEAKSAVKALADDLRRELISRGVPARNIVVEGGTRGPMGIIGDEALEDMPQMAEAMAKVPKSARMTIKLELSDMSLLQPVRRLLDEREAVVAEPPSFKLRNDRVARDAAIAAALEKARADAEAYARPLGLRVGRIVEMRDLATSPSMLGGFDTDMMKAIMRQGRGDDSATVVTEVQLAVDFILLSR